MPALLEQLESDRLSAIRTIDSEIETLNELKKSLDAESLTKALDFMQNAKGRIIITGMGKSGHIGKKIAASLASTGTPSFFVHPAEASHGDLGMITEDDVVIAELDEVDESMEENDQEIEVEFLEQAEVENADKAEHVEESEEIEAPVEAEKLEDAMKAVAAEVEADESYWDEEEDNDFEMDFIDLDD